MFDKDNPPDDKDNPSNVKTTSPSDPNTVRFVSPETDQHAHSTTHSENDDMLTKTAIMEDISLMMSDYNDPPNDKDNSPNVKMSLSSNPKTLRFVSTLATNKPPINPPINSTTRTKNDDKFLTKMARALAAWGYKNDNPPDDDVTMSSVQTEKVVESLLPSSVTSLHSFTTHSKSTNNTKNNPNITPLPPPPPSPPLKSHKIDTTCTINGTDKVMTNKYVSTGPYESVSSSFGYPQTPPPNPFDLTPPTPSTKSVRKIREKRRKRSKQKARDRHTKNLEKQVAELQQQLNEKQKQKQKEMITSELYESLERSKQLEMEKLEQLDNLIEEKEEDREERRRRRKRNKIINEKDNQWRKMMNKTVQAYEKGLIAKQKQLDMLIQQQKQYEIENKNRETKIVERLQDLEEEQVQQIEEHVEVLYILSKEQERQKLEHAEVLHQQQIQYEEKLQKLEQEQECYRKENENKKLEHAELLQKFSEAMEHYQREDERRKIEYEQMFSKIQTSSCVVMDATKNTDEDNSKLQVVIKATHDSINKLKAQARKAFKSTREHF